MPRTKESLREKILNTIAEHARISQADLRSITGIAQSTLNRRILKMEGEGVIRVERSGRGLPSFVSLATEYAQGSGAPSGNLDSRPIPSDAKNEPSGSPVPTASTGGVQSAPLLLDRGRPACQANGSYSLAKAELEMHLPIAMDYVTLFQEQLEYFFPTIHKVACAIARDLQSQHTDMPESRIYELTQAVLEAGAQVAVQDVQRRGVVRQECANCPFAYPQGSSPANRPAPRDKPPITPHHGEGVAVSHQPPIVESPIALPPHPQAVFVLNPKAPLESEIHRFIQQHPQVQATVIFTTFADFQISEIDVSDALTTLINDGKVYQPRAGFYKEL